MSKRNARKSNNTRFILIGAAVVVIAVVLLLLSSGGATPVTAAKITPADYQSQYVSKGTPHLLLDVRTPEEYATGHIAGSVNISITELQNRLAEVPKDKPVVVYCRSGNRSNQAMQLLSAAGYTQISDLGGIISWVDAGYPVE